MKHLRFGESATVPRKQARRCPFCKASFLPQYQDQKFCKPQHRKNYGARLRREAEAEKKLASSRTCRYCQLPFVAKKKNQEFCSADHRRAFWKHGVLPFEKLMATVQSRVAAPLRALIAELTVRVVELEAWADLSARLGVPHDEFPIRATPAISAAARMVAPDLDGSQERIAVLSRRGGGAAA